MLKSKYKDSKFKLQILLLCSVLFLNFFSILAPVRNIYADNGSAICVAQTDATQNIGNCINRIYIISLAVGGIIAVLLFVIAGYFYITGGERVGTAKKIITSTITGLVFLFSAFLLLNTINPDLTNFSGTDLSLSNVTCGTGQTLCTPPSTNLGNTVQNPGSGIATGTTNSGGTFVIDGYNLTSYSTSSTFASQITSVFNSIQAQNLTDPNAITNYMQTIVNGLGSNALGPLQLTGAMVLNAASQYGVDSNMLLTIMRVESGYGTTSKPDIKTFNPGSVGNEDDGSTINDGNWQAGVNALASWLSKHKGN